MPENKEIKPSTLTEGRIVFLCSLALCLGATFSLIHINPQFSVALTLGFVMFAQEIINAYFQSEDDSLIKKKIVLLLTIGYCAIFGVSLWKYNDMVSGTLITGFLFFIRKIGGNFFGIITPQNPLSESTQPKI